MKIWGLSWTWSIPYLSALRHITYLPTWSSTVLRKYIGCLSNSHIVANSLPLCTFLSLGEKTYPFRTCHDCCSFDIGTWLYILIKCQQQHIYAFIMKRHNKSIQKLRKLIVLITQSRHYTLMNTWTHNKLPHDNTTPPWLLPCTCGAQRWHCIAICIVFKPYIHRPYYAW